MSKESKFEPQIPTLGQPVFVIVDNPLEDRVSIAGERGLLNALVYFAVDAILVRSLGYLDETLRRIIINKGMKDEHDPEKSLEIVLDLDKNFARGEVTPSTIFVSEAEAQAVARKANENQKKSCKKLLDLVTSAFNEYDRVIEACKITVG